MIYTEDHSPAHVHARSPEGDAIFLLHCDESNVSLRGRFNVSDTELKAVSIFLKENVSLLCEAWEQIHGH